MLALLSFSPESIRSQRVFVPIQKFRLFLLTSRTVRGQLRGQRLTSTRTTTTEQLTRLRTGFSSSLSPAQRPVEAHRHACLQCSARCEHERQIAFREIAAEKPKQRNSRFHALLFCFSPFRWGFRGAPATRQKRLAGAAAARRGSAY